MDTTRFFEDLLGLTAPYSVSKIEQQITAERSVHIYVEVSSSYQPVDSNGTKGIKHDIESRTWRHLDLFQYPCYIHCDVPKFKYTQSKKSYVKTLVVPWSRPKSGFTLLFEYSS